MEFEQLQRAIEAILFAAGEPVETARLSHALETDVAEIIRAAQALADAYAFERRGIRIVRLDKDPEVIYGIRKEDEINAWGVAFREMPLGQGSVPYPAYLKALDDIAERNQRQLPPPTVNFQGIVGKEPYPVTKKAGEVIRRLVLKGIERLKNLFKGNRSRSEIVATFLAVLELCKTNSVSLEDDVSGENPNVRLLDETNTQTEVQ